MAALDFFKKVLPFLTAGLSIAGPAGALAASVLGNIPALKTAAGENPTVDGITKALSSLTLTPELTAQLKEAELQYQAQMQKMGFDDETAILKIAADDRASARQMQIQTKTWIVPLLAILVTFGFFTLLALMLFHSIPTASENVLDTLIGVLGTAWIAIVNYYFGSSAAHVELTKTLATNGH